jgi:hypothetical protein
VSRSSRANGPNDVVRTYLPAHFYARIPRPDRPWRGRIVLTLWGLGYPLEMAWSLGMTSDPDQSAAYRDAVGQLDDQRLVRLLDASAETRGDGHHLEFVSFGLIAPER